MHEATSRGGSSTRTLAVAITHRSKGKNRHRQAEWFRGSTFAAASCIIGAMAFSTTLIGIGTLAITGACVLSLGCSSTTAPPAGGAGGSSATGTGGDDPGYGGEASWEVETGSGGCNAVIYEPPVVKSPHIETCSKVDYLSMPPTSGPHYPKWAHFQSYDSPLPWGFLVHALEHGAVLLATQCDGCDALSDIEAWAADQDVDPGCVAPTDNRLIVAPAPELDVPFAMAAWGAMLKADCFDPAIAELFVERYYAGGPEDFCNAGFDPTDPTEMIPADCGQ